MLDELCAEAPVDDVRGGRERGVDVTSPHDRGGEHVAVLVQERRVGRERGERARDGLQHLVLDLDERGRLARGVARLGGDAGDHVADVRRRLADGDELAPVLFQGSEHALARHVGGGQDADHAGVRFRLRRVDAQDSGTRMVGEAQCAVEHPGLAEVGHERLVAESELVGAVAQSPLADTVAAGLRQRLAAPCAGREQHRVDDLHVTGATAEIAEQRVRDVVSSRHGVLGEERLRLHHDPRRAEAALRRTGDGEAVGPELPRLGAEALLRDDVLALDAGRLLRARDDGAPVDEDGARAAGAFRRAPVLHRPELELLAQELEQALPVAWLDVDGPAVDGQLHDYSIAPNTRVRSAIRRTTPLNASCQ